MAACLHQNHNLQILNCRQGMDSRLQGRMKPASTKTA